MAEHDELGRVHTEATIASLEDLWAAEQGLISPEQIRRVTVQDALVDTGDDVPVLIGQLPLEHLDLVVDLRSRTLIGNPAHGGEHVYELL